MRIYGKAGQGKNTTAPSKRSTREKGKTKPVKRLERRQADYDAIPIGNRKGRKRPGSLKKG